MMSSTVLSAVILLACAFTFNAAQMSCRGRCGVEYYRGSTCQCDYNCLSYDECCPDYEAQCTTKNSCKGRCGESFKRGRRCSCDSDCLKFKQCCPDFKMHCDAEEQISGAASATAPEKTNSCQNVNDNKPKEPTLNEATDQDSTFSEGNNEDDHLIPLVSPTSYPPEDVSDDMYGQVFPSDEFSNNGVEDLEASPIPESTSGYGLSTADLLDQISAEPTQDPDTLEFNTETFTAVSQTQMTPSDVEPTQVDDSPSTLHPDTEGATTESPDAGDPTSSGAAFPQPTAAADDVSSRPPPTSEPQTADSPAANIPKLEAVGQGEDDLPPEAENTEPTDMPEVQTTASPVLEDSQVTTKPASSTLEPTSIPEGATSNPDDDGVNTEDVTTSAPLPHTEDPSISVSPALTTDIPASTDAAQADATDGGTPGETTADPVNVTPDPTKPATPEADSKPQDKPEAHKPLPAKPAVAKPDSKPDAKPLDTLNVDDPREYQADDSNDTNLCSGRPVSAVTTLRNGTIVVFRGHYFWLLDGNRVPGPAQGITQVWGVPSPIDTVFTRCNCQGKTYIFKGTQYWRFENDVLDAGYPKVVETGFDGLRGHITAALSVPQYQRRRESVYFFKRGGTVQKYSYLHGTSSTCGRKPQYAIYAVRNRVVRQAVSLSPAINIRTSWRGFPSTITAAVSVPNRREPDGYKYYVFSRSKSYNVRMDGERPAVAAPTANTSPQSSSFFKCPNKV